MDILKAKYENGSTRIWLNGQEIESVNKCTIELDARKIPVVHMTMELDRIEIDEALERNDIKITRKT